MGDWTFFSNHGHVLVCLARDHDARLRDVAVQVGITERAVQKIVRDLQDEGYLEIRKHGRRNRYRINNRKALRHSLQSGITVGQLLALLSKSEDEKRAKPAEPTRPSSKPVAKSPERADPPKPVANTPEKPEPPKPAPVEPAHSAPGDDKPAKSDLEQGQLF